MRIATWNVAYGLGASMNQRRLSQMMSVDADIWVLTETHESLCPGDDHYEAARADQRRSDTVGVVDGSSWVTIWCRTPFVAAAVDGLADPGRTAACLVTADEHRLVVYETVLPWYTDTERDGMRAELERQAPEWTSLAERFDAPVCVAGDFNVNLGGPHYYGSTESKGLVAEALRGADLTALTNYAATRELREHGLIDHIAVSDVLAPAARISHIWEPRTGDGPAMSDHPGVAVDVDLTALP